MAKLRMLDLFAGKLGWAKAFLDRGWDVTAVDLVRPDDIPSGCNFVQADVLQIEVSRSGLFTIREHDDRGPILWEYRPDFMCASSSCEEFSKFGMRCFNPNPPYPELGITLFNHTRNLGERSGVPYVMENVRAAQQFVGTAKHHCGPFYLWGTAVPPLMPQGIIKGMTRLAIGHKDYKGCLGWNTKNTAAPKRLREKQAASKAATIPPELSSCVADYAEALMRVTA